MGFFSNLFNTKAEEELFFESINLKARELHIKEHLIEHAIDLIAKTIAKSEIQIFKTKGKKVVKAIDNDYYKLNVEPNPNEDGTKFMYNVVHTLLKENEVLIIKLKGDYYLADRWDETPSVIKGKTYFNIFISDDNLNEEKVNGTFAGEDVIHISLGQSDIKNTLDSFYQEFADLLRAASNGYQQDRSKKYRMTPATPNLALKDPKTGEEVSMTDYKDVIADGLLSNKSTLSMIPSSFGLELLESKGSSAKTDDFRELLKVFGETVAMSFNIPIDVYFGKQTDKSNATNEFITFAVLPIIELIEDNFNRKVFSKEEYKKGSKIKFNTFTMKHFDIMDVATSLDKLFAIGWSHNNLKEILGQPTVNEEWANRHHVTKNYMDIEETSEGGG